MNESVNKPSIIVIFYFQFLCINILPVVMCVSVSDPLKRGLQEVMSFHEPRASNEPGPL